MIANNKFRATGAWKNNTGSAAISCVVVALRSLSLVACTVVCRDACVVLFVSYLLIVGCAVVT